MVQCLNVLKLVRACMTREIHMVATVTSNRGNANRQVLQLHGTKTDSTVTTTDLETTADLHLHGQVAIVAATVMAATAALLAAVLRHGTSKHLHHRRHHHRLPVSLATATARILAMIKALVMGHLQPQLPQASAHSCINTQVRPHLHRVTGHRRLRHPTTLLPRRHRLTILLLHRRHERSHGATAVARAGDGRYSKFESGENCLACLEARLLSRGEARKLGCGMDSQFTPWVLDWGFVFDAPAECNLPLF